MENYRGLRCLGGFPKGFACAVWLVMSAKSIPFAEVNTKPFKVRSQRRQGLAAAEHNGRAVKVDHSGKERLVYSPFDRGQRSQST
jgi:hypothetical protein